MFDVTFHNLAPDLTGTQAGAGVSARGDVDEAQLVALLDAFRRIDAVENSEADPHIVIESAGAKLLVRTGHGKLFAYNARNLSEPFVELDPAGIVRQLGHQPAPVAAEPAAPAPLHHPRRHGLAITILVLAVALNAYTIYSFVHVRPIHSPPVVEEVADPKAADAVRLAAAGRYITGPDPGDRVIEIAPDGHVRFLRFTTGGHRAVADSTYRVANRNGHPCLVTATGSVIDVQNIYTVVYYHDVYRRQR